MKKIDAVLAALAFLVASSAQAQTILKFSHTDQQAGGRQAAAQVFAKKVEELTQGRYKVQIYCCSQLGSDPKNIEQIILGGIDFTVSATGSYAPHVPTLNLTMLPFLVDSYEQGWKYYDTSAWLQQQFDKAPAKGFRFLSPVGGRISQHDDQGAAQLAERRRRNEAAYVSRTR